MSDKGKPKGFSLKAIYFSIRDALAYRQIDRDPGNRDAVNGGYNVGDNTPRIDRALQLSTVWACVKLKSNAISTLPLFIYERTEVNGRESRRVAREHPLYRLLHDSPNADMTARDFWNSIQVRLDTWGNAYVLKTFSGNRIVSLDPLDPGLMTVRRTNGTVQFLYAAPGGRKEYTERDIWHIKGFTEDGLTGLSPIGVGARSMARAQSAESASSALFSGDMRPSGVVSVDPILTKDQRTQMQEAITNGIFGDARMGRQYLLEGGAKYQQLTINPVDAQLIEQVSASVEDLCRWYGVPPAMIGHGTAVSNWGTGREQQNLGFLQYVIDPDLVGIEQSIAKNLLTPAERLKYFAEFSREGFFRMDSSGRSAYYDKMIKAAVYTPNFCRSLENLEPLPGGDNLFMQSNMIPLDMVGKITSTTQNPDTIAQEPKDTTNET
jgi:HK97 family phage portal protein